MFSVFHFFFHNFHSLIGKQSWRIGKGKKQLNRQKAKGRWAVYCSSAFFHLENNTKLLSDVAKKVGNFFSSFCSVGECFNLNMNSIFSFLFSIFPEKWKIFHELNMSYLFITLMLQAAVILYRGNRYCFSRTGTTLII